MRKNPRLDRVIPLEIRFWKKVDKSRGADGCWLWTGAKNRKGYGLVRVGKPGNWKMMVASRVSLMLKLGRPLDENEVTRHIVCDNPPCVNPSHLVEGTKGDNYEDARIQGRHTHGEIHGNRKLDWDLVREIRSFKGRATTTSIGSMFGISQAHVSKIWLNQTWQDGV